MLSEPWTKDKSDREGGKPYYSLQMSVFRDSSIDRLSSSTASLWAFVSLGCSVPSIPPPTGLTPASVVVTLFLVHHLLLVFDLFLSVVLFQKISLLYFSLEYLFSSVLFWIIVYSNSSVVVLNFSITSLFVCFSYHMRSWFSTIRQTLVSVHIIVFYQVQILQTLNAAATYEVQLRSQLLLLIGFKESPLS